MKIQAFLLCAALFFSRETALSQSGWVKNKGELYAQLSAMAYSSNDYFSVSGMLNKNAATFRQQAINAYAEYGIVPRFTGILNASLLRLNSYSTTNVVAAPGDLRLELKYALSKKIPLALSVAPEIPLGPADNFATAKKANDLGVFESINLATTDGEFNVWTTLAASAPLPNGKGWASAWGAYNLRTKGFTDQFFTGLELGYKPVEPVFLKMRFTVLASLGDPKQNVPFFRGEGTEMTAASFGGGWQFGKNWGLTADVWKCFDVLVSPKNAYAAAVFSVGVFYKK